MMAAETYADVIEHAKAPPLLSRREWLVWACIVAGMSRAQAAESLAVKTSTIDTHLERIHAKLGTTGLGRFALERPVTHG